MAFEAFFQLAKTYGIFEFYLPFLLVLTLFYGVLQKIQLFGKEGKRFNMIIALVGALYVMVYSPVAITITQFFSTLFTETAVAIMTLVVGVMIVGVLGGPDVAKLKEKWMGPALFVGILLGIFIFVSSGGLQLFMTVMGPEVPISPEDLIMIILIIITIAAIWYMTKEEKGGKIVRITR